MARPENNPRQGVSVTTAAHSRRSSKQIYLLLGVLLSVLATFGIRYHAAAEVTEREEVDGVVFEMSDDDLVGWGAKDQNIRYEQDFAASASQTVSKGAIDVMGVNMKISLKEDYGWDLSSSADRKSIQDEANQLRQALRSIPDSDLESEEQAVVVQFRDALDMLNGVSECRGRCLLPGEDFSRIFSMVAIGSAIAKIEAEFADPSSPRSKLVVTMLAVSYSLYALATEIILERTFRIDTRPLRIAVMGALFVTLVTMRQYRDDARGIAAASSSTPADDAKEGAKDISELTPAPDDDPGDYDMVHDEL
jgi:hypothetical protein